MDTSPPDQFRETMELLGEFHQELCGLVTDEWHIIPIMNIAKDRHRDFEMNAVSLAWALANYSIIGMYHTHPGGTREPSTSDINNAPYGLRYFIAVPGELIEWRFDGTPPVAYEVHHIPEGRGPEASAASGEGVS